jgi:hypothetical protein
VVHGGALLTILFETTFILLIFGRRTFYLAGVIGVSFHTLMNVFMRHGFETLRNAYVMFINWHGLFIWLGGKLFSGKLHVNFDSRAARGAAMVAMVRVFDWFGAIEWIDVSNAKATEGIDLSEGSKAWRRVLQRVPLLWPAIPILYAIPSTRMTDAPAAGDSTRTELRRNSDSTSGGLLLSVYATAAVGIFLVVGLVMTGAQRSEASWPVACYPLFDGILDDTVDLLRIDSVDAAGAVRSIEPVDYSNELGGRWRYVLQRIISMDEGPRRQELLNAVWGIVESREKNLANTETIRFYTRAVWLDPNRWNEAPGPAELIHELKR